MHLRMFDRAAAHRQQALVDCGVQVVGSLPASLPADLGRPPHDIVPQWTELRRDSRVSFMTCPQPETTLLGEHE